jgi:hypothetical protein
MKHLTFVECLLLGFGLVLFAVVFSTGLCALAGQINPIDLLVDLYNRTIITILVIIAIVVSWLLWWVGHE